MATAGLSAFSLFIFFSIWNRRFHLVSLIFVISFFFRFTFPPLAANHFARFVRFLEEFDRRSIGESLIGRFFIFIFFGFFGLFLETGSPREDLV